MVVSTDSKLSILLSLTTPDSLVSRPLDTNQLLPTAIINLTNATEPPSLFSGKKQKLGEEVREAVGFYFETSQK